MASKPPPANELRVFPHELRPGDRVTVNGQEWEVAAAPAVYLQGKMQTVRLRKPGDPERDLRRAHGGA
jgi:hypothetical protein